MKSLFNHCALAFCMFMLFSGTGQATINKDLFKNIDDKQATAARLISNIGLNAYDRFTFEPERQEAQFAYSGFMERFEVLREERESYNRKEIIPDEATLEKYSKRYDQLITELKAYLSGNRHY